MPDLVDIRRAAAMLAVSTSTVERLARRRALSVYRIGRCRRFDQADIMRYLRAHLRRAEEP